MQRMLIFRIEKLH